MNDEKLEKEALQFLRSRTVLQKQIRPLAEELRVIEIRLAVVFGQMDEEKALR